LSLFISKALRIGFATTILLAHASVCIYLNYPNLQHARPDTPVTTDEERTGVHGADSVVVEDETDSDEDDATPKNAGIITTIRGKHADVQMLIEIIEENSSLRKAPPLSRAAADQINGLYPYAEVYCPDADRAFVQHGSLDNFKAANDPKFAEFCKWLDSCDEFAKGAGGRVINRFCALYQGYGITLALHSNLHHNPKQ